MIKSNLPVILLKNLVLLPYQEVRVEIRSEISKKVTEISKLYHDSEVLVVCPLDTLEETPDTSDLPRIGVVGKIKSIIDLPNGSMRVIISGLERVKVISYVNYSNEEEVLDSIITGIEITDSEIESIAYSRKLISELENYVNKNPFVTNSIMSQLKGNMSLDKVKVNALIITISQKDFVISFFPPTLYAISLCPYIATPNEPNNIKYVTIEIVYPYIPIGLAPKTLDK